MSGMMKFVSMVIMAAILMAAIAPHAEAQIGCSTVVSMVSPCIPYLTSNAPLGGCCGGVKSLNAAAKTPADRKSVCGCLKSLAGSYSGAAVSKAAGLPGTCGVSIPYKISPSTDCAKVQ